MKKCLYCKKAISPLFNGEIHPTCEKRIVERGHKRPTVPRRSASRGRALELTVVQGGKHEAH